MLFTADCEAQTEEEREAVKAECLTMVGKCIANMTILNRCKADEYKYYIMWKGKQQ